MDTGISGSYGASPRPSSTTSGEFQVWGETEEVAARSGIRPPPPKPLAPREMEAFLRTAAVTGRGPGPGGRTDAWRLTLEAEGSVLSALFRYIDRRRPDPLADSYKYDLAAYALDKYLGLGLRPADRRADRRGRAGRPAGLRRQRRSMTDLRERRIAPEDPEAFERAMADLVVFQALVYDDCRNEKDTLVSGDDGRIYRVDFSEAFAPKKGDVSRLRHPQVLAAPLPEAPRPGRTRTVAAYLGRYLEDGRDQRAQHPAHARRPASSRC